MKMFTDKDMVDVFDEAGEPAGRVPKSWVGTDLLPHGVGKSKGGASASTADEPVEIPDGEPSDDWTVKQIDAYASREGFDLGDASNKGDKLAAVALAIEAKQV